MIRLRSVADKKVDSISPNPKLGRPPLPADEEARRMELYNKRLPDGQRLTDEQIADALAFFHGYFVATETVTSWRGSRGLPAHHTRELSEAEERRRMEVYRLKVNDMQAERMLGLGKGLGRGNGGNGGNGGKNCKNCDGSVFRQWRKSRGLKSWAKRGRPLGAKDSSDVMRVRRW